MKIDKRLLDLEIRLLVLRHGREEVLDAIARLGEVSVRGIEREIVAAEATRRATAGRGSARVTERKVPEIKAPPDSAGSHIAARWV